MTRSLTCLVAVLLLLPASGRAAGLGAGGICEKAPGQQRAGQPPVNSARGDRPGEKDPGHPPQPKWWIDAKLRADLGITDQQSAAVDQVWNKSLPPLRDARERLEKLEDALSQMTGGVSDEGAVIAQIDRVESARAELNKSRTLMIYRMHKLLTADQRAKVKAMYERRDPPRRDPSSR